MSSDLSAESASVQLRQARKMKDTDTEAAEGVAGLPALIVSCFACICCVGFRYSV